MEIDYSKMLDCYNNLNKVTEDLIENIRSIKKIVNSLGSKELWMGKGYNSYNSKVNNISSNFISCCEELKKLNDVLLFSVEKYKTVDSKIMESVKGVSP